MSESTLRGISWDHSRAYPPLVAVAQRFEETHPHIKIVWEKRSLHEFGHATLSGLCAHYDLIILDHPMLGEAHEQNLLVNLKPLLRPELLSDMSGDSLGNSFKSYLFEDSLYALPIDAAAPTASFRPDLFAKLDLAEPTSWQELLAICQRGLVRMPCFPADLFLNFMGLCVSYGATITPSREILVERSIALQCLKLLHELASYMPDEVYSWNPIALYEQMTATDDFAYCPFAYSYSNYSRSGFAPHKLRFSSPVPLPNGQALRTVLGGTGIAISQTCKLRESALAFAEYVQSPICQRTLYALAGGQPARASASRDGTLNEISDDFFLRTLPCMDQAYVRPRYAGYVPFQEKAGAPLAEYLLKRQGPNSGTNLFAEQTLDRIDALYRESLGERKHA
jgi:multiple sugar transport system substrate-binding protein